MFLRMSKSAACETVEACGQRDTRLIPCETAVHIHVPMVAVVPMAIELQIFGEMLAAAARRHMANTLDVNGRKPRLSVVVRKVRVAAAILGRTGEITDRVAHGPHRARYGPGK